MLFCRKFRRCMGLAFNVLYNNTLCFKYLKMAGGIFIKGNRQLKDLGLNDGDNYPK